MSKIIQSKKNPAKRLLLILSVFIGIYTPSTAFALNTEINENQHLKIIASIKPIQLLVNDIQGELNSAEVLLKNNQNHHLTSLKPSQRRQLAEADVVFYIDNDFEVFLKKIMHTDKFLKAKYIALGDSAGMRLLSLRYSGEMPHTFVAGVAGHDHGHGDHSESSVDWHIWLSPDNAIVMLARIRDTLSKIDPSNAQKYNSNFNRVSRELIEHSMETAQKMKSVMRTPFFTLHDGYQYFEEQYGLQSKATILRHGESSPSLKHMNLVKNIQKEKSVNVVLKEHQFSTNSLQAITDKQHVKVVHLDSLGQNLPEDMTSYLDFIKVFTDAFYTGLSQLN